MTSEAEVLMDLEVLCPTDYFSVSYQNLCPIPVKYAYPMAININTINGKKCILSIVRGKKQLIRQPKETLIYEYHLQFCKIKT